MELLFSKAIETPRGKQGTAQTSQTLNLTASVLTS